MIVGRRPTNRLEMCDLGTNYRHLLRPFHELEIGCHLTTSLAVKKSDRATNDHHTTANRVDFDRRDDVGTRAARRVVSSSARTASHETTTDPARAKRGPARPMADVPETTQRREPPACFAPNGSPRGSR
jgi:hypothetical protein